MEHNHSTNFSKTLLEERDGPLYEASKWLHTQLLIDKNEMEGLLSALSPFHIFLISGVYEPGQEYLSKEDFINIYSSYIDHLKNGTVPEESKYRACFSCVWTKEPNTIFAKPVGDQRRLIRICKPVVQLQLNSIGYSPADGKIRPMVFGKESVSWGLQISYPQIFKNPETKEVEVIAQHPEYVNTLMFKEIQGWIRNFTSPTPFLVDGRKLYATIRIGKECLAWINNHPQLKGKNIKVEVRKELS